MNFADAEFYKSVFRPEDLDYPEKAEIVFSGKSNVGKSSLINKLLNRKGLARISSEPGKTASINFYRCGSAGSNVFLVDLPGYGFAKVSKEIKKKWGLLVDGYFGGQRKIALVIQLMDIRHTPSADDETMLRYLQQCGLPFIVVLTKSDKLKKMQLSAKTEEYSSYFAASGIHPGSCIVASARTGEGMAAIRGAVARAAESFTDHQ